MLFEVLLSGFFMVFCMILGSLNKNTGVIASEQSERGNLHTTENGGLNQEIATPTARNDGNVWEIATPCVARLAMTVWFRGFRLPEIFISMCHYEDRASGLW